MSSGGAAGVVTMKATAVFPQSASHLPSQHTQVAALQPNSVLQPNTFNQQMQQQQHLLQQQHQRAQAQHTQQLHRLSQSHSISSVHPAQAAAAAAAVGNNAQTSVFPNADFFQTLQQTAAAALPTVLPYDQSQYIGPLMYFPYPTAAAAAANGLFGPTSASDSQHTVCSTASASGVNPVSSNTNHLLGAAGLVSAAPGAMVTLNHASGSSGQVHGASQLLSPAHGLVGLSAAGTNAASASTPTLAPASLAPLFSTAHFYPHQPTQDPSGQPQIHLQHALQPHHAHNLQMQQQLHPLSGHSTIHTQSPTTATAVLLPGQMHHSSMAQINATVNTQSNLNQRHLSAGATGANSGGSNSGNDIKLSSTNNSSNGSSAGGGGSCDGLPKSDETVHSTPNPTPLKSAESELLNQNSQLTNQSQNSNSALEVSSSSTKRDNSGTGHFACSVCGREFGMRCRLIAHTRRHTGERPFPCADCGRAFSDRGNLQRHRYTHSSQPRFHCSVCGKSFRQASCLSNHRRFHCAGATGRPCPFCQRSFRSSSSLQMHIRWKHRADAAAAVAAAAAAAASASGTSDAFTYLPGLTTYMPTASMNGIPAMSLNGGGWFSHSSNVLGCPSSGLHEYSATNSPLGLLSSLDLQGSSLLSAAAAVAASAAIVNNGMSNAHGSGAITTTAITPTMSCTAPSLPNPLVHLNTINSPNKRKWRRKPKPKQNAFGRLTGDGMNILAGINLSEGIDVNAAAAAAGAAAAAAGGPVPLDRKGRPCNFPCPACPRRFAFQCRLAAHLRCHTNIRPFICIDCGRAFTQRGYLVRHAAVHKLDRPFTCGLCDRSYKHYGSLVNHKRTHSKLSSSNLGSLALLPNTGMDHLGCDVSVTPVTGLSSLEEVVSGTVGQSNKAPDGSGVTSTSTTTITLLPVSKVEEILPGDMSGSVQQICLPSLACPPGNLLPLSDRHLTETDSHGVQPHSLPHQLTATAVWPILASGHPAAQSQMIASTNMPSQMAPGSHFSTLTLPPQSAHSVGQQQHHVSLLSSQRQQQQSNNTSMLSATATGTPAFVTVPLFGSQTQTVTNNAANTSLASTHHAHHTFDSTGTASASESSQNSHTHSHQQSQPVTQVAQLSTHHPSSAQQSTTTGDVSTTSMLHVLQPSPSIFFSPYYLPHSAASQM